MSKTPIVYAQQRWEYLEVTRKTEASLINELNHLGEIGWEMVSVLHHLETKSGLGSSMAWTAFLKRPHAGHAPGTAVQEKPAVAPMSAGPAKTTPSENSEVFEFRSG